MSKVIYINVLEKDSGRRLDKVLAEFYPKITYSEIAKLVRKGNIRVDGAKVKTNDRVETGQEIRIPPELTNSTSRPDKEVREKKTLRLSKQDREMLADAKIYENKDILVLNKPQGMPTQGGTGVKKSLDVLLRTLGKEQSPAINYHVVHRLDKDTTGVIIFAKSREAAAFLTNAFKEGQVQKEYLALSVGTPSPLKGQIDAAMGKTLMGDVEKMVLMPQSEGGQKAVTDYEVLDVSSQQVTLVKLEPQTGRTHQLRVHLNALECPILGDGKYAGQAAHPNKRYTLKLHAQHITFPMPRGGVKKFTAKLPDLFREAMREFGLKT